MVVYLVEDALFTGYQAPESFLTRIRKVALLPDERVSHVFSSQEGFVDEPTSEGRLLITTNQRIISFSQEESSSETVLVPIEELKGVVVKNISRSSGSLMQGLLLIAGGIFIYLIISYWLTGRIDGPKVPLINLDAGPLIILLGLTWGGWLVGKHYFTKTEGLLTFHGSNWTFSFPLAGEKAGEEVYQVVNTVFDTRNSRNGYYPPLPE